MCIAIFFKSPHTITVDDSRRKIVKRQVNEVEKAEIVIRAYKEKKKKARVKIARAAAKVGKARLKRLKDKKELIKKLEIAIKNRK